MIEGLLLLEPEGKGFALVLVLQESGDLTYGHIASVLSFIKAE